MTSTVGDDEGLEQDQEIKLSLPARASFARVARLAVTGLATRVGFSYDEIEDLRIAVGELCSVLLDDGTGRLTFRCTVGDDHLAVEASRHPVGVAPTVTDLTRQILVAVVDEVEITPDEARLRISKRRQD